MTVNLSMILNSQRVRDELPHPLQFTNHPMSINAKRFSFFLYVFTSTTNIPAISWYSSRQTPCILQKQIHRPPGSTSEEFQLFREQLDYIRTHHKGKKLPSAHVLGDFNFKDIDWPDRLSKSGSTLSQSEGQILIDIMNDHGLEQMVHFPTREKNTLDLILTTLPGQFRDVHSPY